MDTNFYYFDQIWYTCQISINGAVEIFSEKTRAFKVNGQRLKVYNTGETVEKEANLVIKDPT